MGLLDLTSPRDVQLLISILLGVDWILLKRFLPRKQPELWATLPARVAVGAVLAGFVSSTIAWIIESYYYTHPLYEPLAAYGCHLAGMIVAASVAFVVACYHPAFFLNRDGRGRTRGQTVLLYLSIITIAAIPLTVPLAFFVPHDIPDLRADLSEWGFIYRFTVAGLPALVHGVMTYNMFTYERRESPEPDTGIRSRSFAYAMAAITLLHLNLVLLPFVELLKPSLGPSVVALERFLEFPIFVAAVVFCWRAFLCGCGESNTERRIKTFALLRDMAHALESKTREFWANGDIAPAPHMRRQREEKLLSATLMRASENEENYTIAAEDHVKARELYALLSLIANDGKDPVIRKEISRSQKLYTDSLAEEPKESPARLLAAEHPLLEALGPALAVSELQSTTLKEEVREDWVLITLMVFEQAIGVEEETDQTELHPNRELLLALAETPA